MFEKEIEKELRKSAHFIKEALTERAAYIEIDSSEEGEPLRIDKKIDESSFTPLDGKVIIGSSKFAAIDGGSATIANGHSFTVDVYRTGYLIFENNNIVDELIEPLAIKAISQANAREVFSSAYHDIVGSPPQEIPNFGRVVNRLRTLKEWALTERLIDKLNSGDLVLIDGSLRSSLSLPYSLVERICRKAAERNIHLIGLTKTSTLYWGERSPLIPVISRMGNRACRNRTWFCQLTKPDEAFLDSRWFGLIHVAKLSPRSDFAFRVDINRYDKEDTKRIMSALALISHDPAYMGYPYPLAAIHNRVRLEPTVIEDLYYRLQSLALEEGVDMRHWETLFADFHELLDVSD
jgi:hypothetical protein